MRLPHETIDLMAFCRSQASREGILKLAAMPRLNAESLDGNHAVSWNALGRWEVLPHQYLADGSAVRQEVLLIAAQTLLTCACNRCGKPLELPLQVRSRLRVYASDAAADAAPVDDDDADPVVASQQFDLVSQVEEELLLALPGFIAHEVCPEQEVKPVSGATAATGPFARLSQLKTRKTQEK
jgi:uncharacterized protein